MSEQPTVGPPPTTAEVRALLHAIAQLLREAHRLDREAQAILADLVEELGRAFESSAVANAEVARLTECASHLIQAVHQEQEPGLLDAARDRLDRAVIAIEEEAPVLAGLTRRLAEMLSNLGI